MSRGHLAGLGERRRWIPRWEMDGRDEVEDRQGKFRKLGMDSDDPGLETGVSVLQFVYVV